METHDALLEDATRRRGRPILPLAIFAGCFCYFAWRYWESRQHVYALLAGLNALGLVMILLRRRR